MNTEMHVLAPISFYGEVFKTKWDVERAIKETEEGRREAEDALCKLVYMTEPSRFMDKDYVREILLKNALKTYGL